LLSAGRILLSQIVSLLVTTMTVATLIANAYALFMPQALPDYLTMPAMTALAILVLSLGMINSNANYALMAVVTSDSEGGAMARRLLPVSLLIPIVLGFLRLIGQNSGWFGPAVGLLLHVMITMLLLALFICWNAWALDRAALKNRQFEQAVQDTRTAMLGILDHVNDAVFGHDLQGNLTFVNSAAERLFAISARDGKSSNIFALFGPRSQAAARELLSKRLIGCVSRPECLVMLTSGGEQECEVATTLLYDRHGIPAAFFSIVSPVLTPSTPELHSVALMRDTVNVS
jgi:PAS domain S-box-containing protein